MTRDELMGALRRADAAGDTEAARAIVRRMDSLQAQPAQAKPVPTDDYTDLQAATIGAGKGLKDAGVGMFQRAVEAQTGDGIFGKLSAMNPLLQPAILANKLLGTDKPMLDAKAKTTQQHLEELALYKKLQEAHPKATMAGEIGAKALATLPLGVSAAAGASLPARVGYGALSGGVGAGADFAQDDKALARNVSMGAGFGGAVTGFLSLAGKTINGIRGRIDENSAAAKKLAEMVKAGFRDESVGYADIMPGQAGELVRHVDSGLSYVPLVGTAAKASRQIDDVQGVMTGLRDKVAGGVEGDVDEAIKRAVEVGRNAAREQSAKNFDNLAGMVPDTATPMANVQRVAQGMLQQKERLGDLIASKDAGLIEQLQRFATPRVSSYDEMRNGVREAISELIETAPNDNVKRIYTQLKTAAEMDIDNLFAEAGKKAPDVRNAYASAKSFHQQNVVPFSQGTLGTILRGGMEDLDRVVDDLAKAGKGRAFAKAYQLTDANGKRAMQLALIEKGLKSAEITGDGGKVFYRPGAFAAQMNKLRKATGVIDDAASKEIQGAINLMSSMQKLDKLIGGEAKTGMLAQKYGPATAGLAGLGVAPAATAQAGGATMLFRALFATKKGRNILLAASDQKAGSKAMQMLFDDAYNFATMAGAQLERGEPIDE